MLFMLMLFQQLLSLVTIPTSEALPVFEVAKLTASDAAYEDIFGNWVSISDNYAIVGAVHDDDDGSVFGGRSK